MRVTPASWRRPTAAKIVIPAKAGIQGWRPVWSSYPSPSTGEGRGEGDPRVLAAANGSQIVIPAKAGIQGWRPVWNSYPLSLDGRGQG